MLLTAPTVETVPQELVNQKVDATWPKVATPEAKHEARARFLAPLRAAADQGFGHLFEIADAEAPHTPRGCPMQAWSLGELLRLERHLAE